MEQIASFTVDHLRMVPGIFESRVDTLGQETATTFDIRLKKPNAEPAMSPSAAHTLEHLVATWLRNNDLWKDRLIYWGPMGCLTGFYMIVKGHPTPEEIYPVILEAFRFVSGFEGEIPGAAPENCGNYLLHNLPMARWEAARYVEYLTTADRDRLFAYPLSGGPGGSAG